MGIMKKDAGLFLQSYDVQTLGTHLVLNIMWNWILHYKFKKKINLNKSNQLLCLISVFSSISQSRSFTDVFYILKITSQVYCVNNKDENTTQHTEKTIQSLDTFELVWRSMLWWIEYVFRILFSYNDESTQSYNDNRHSI